MVLFQIHFLNFDLVIVLQCFVELALSGEVAVAIQSRLGALVVGSSTQLVVYWVFKTLE